MTEANVVNLPPGRWVMVGHPDDAPAGAKLIHIQNTSSDICNVRGFLDGSLFALMPSRDVWVYDLPKRITILTPETT